MSIRGRNSRNVPSGKGSRVKGIGLFALAIFLLQVKRAASVPDHASSTVSPQINNQSLNSSTGPSAHHEIPGKDGNQFSGTDPDFPVQKNQPNQGHHVSSDRDVNKTHSSTVIRNNETSRFRQVGDGRNNETSRFRQVGDGRNNETSRFRQVGDGPETSLSSLSRNNITSEKLESVTHSSNNVTDLYNATHSLNYSTSPESSSLIFHDKLNPAEDTSTHSKARRGGNNKVQNELKLLSDKLSLPKHHGAERKNADDIAKTYIKSRKKKRRKYSSPIHSSNHHRHHNRRHHRKVKQQRRKSVVSDEISFKEKGLMKKRRSLQLSARHPLLPGGSERALLRFKRKALFGDDEDPKQNVRKKSKRKKRREALRRHAKERSLPNLFNIPMNVLTKGYPRGAAWGRPLTSIPKGFVTNGNAISQAKYEQLLNRGQTPSLMLNPYRVSSNTNRYSWGKPVSNANNPSSSPVSSVNVARSGIQFAKEQVQLASFPSETRKLGSRPTWSTTFQNAPITVRAQIQQPTKVQYATENSQGSNRINNDLSRKQFIPATQSEYYGYEPQFNYRPQLFNSQMSLAGVNPQVTPYPGPTSAQFVPRVSAGMQDWSSGFPYTNSHAVAGGPQGLVMYLNFEDVESGKAQYASFTGNVEGAGKRTEISKSFGSCGKVARISNGSEILLHGGQIKVKPRQAISIAAWIKLDTNKGYHSIFDTVGGHSLHQKGQYHFEIQDGSVRWFHRNESDNTIFSVETAPIIPANIWNHVAGTYDARTGMAKIFVNGRLKAEAAGKGLLSQDWDAHAGIGKHKDTRFLQGEVDEFRIYNKALSQEDIHSLIRLCSFERACGGFFYSPTGVIESPEWPKQYKGKTLCTWHVSVDPSEKIALRFNSFSLEEDGTCNKAKLVVRDGNSDDANVLGVYCGNKRPPELTSTGHRLWLQFASAEGAEGKGFLLYYDTASSRQTKKTERPPTPVDDAQRCAVTKPEYNVTLIGGIKSGTFSQAKHVHDMDLCTRHCCLRKPCDLAFMIRDTCYLVKCADGVLCKTKKARPSNMNPRISFVSHLQALTPKPELSADGSAYNKAVAPSVTRPLTLPPKVQPVCHHTAVSYNVTLVGGINAGKFSTYGSTRTMDECIHHCCHDDKCDVSFMIQGNCYAVECADTEGCQVKRAKPSAYHPTVAYVYRGNGRPIGDPLPGAEKPSLDACSKLSVSNTIYNVTLRGGIKSGNFTDKGVVKNMDECSAFCCADERCNVAFLIRDNCFLVTCKDYGSCAMKPALSEYYHPRLAYVNWSPPDDEIPANRWYASLGCWKDTESFAAASLEGSDPLLQGSYVTRDNPIDTCAKVARKHDYKVFAIQNGGACLGGPAAGRMFNQFGESSSCKAGKGALFVNDVYRLTDSGSYISLGCWNDSGGRAIPLLEHSDPQLDDFYKTRSDPLLKCGQVARKRGYTVFALQRGGMCFAGPRAEIDYRKYGISRRCHDGLGGAYANSIYRLIDNLEVTPTGSTQNAISSTTGGSTASTSATGSSSSTPSNDFTSSTLSGTQRSPTTSPSPTPHIQENYLTLQNGLPHKNTYTAGDIQYNVTLKYGIKAGKFNDKGKLGNMSECVRACGRMETCSLAFMLGKQCFAVSCYNDALCLTKPAFSPFYKPKIAFVKHTKEVVTANTSKALSDFSQCRTSVVHNGVTLVGGINAGKFTDLGEADNMSTCTQRCCIKDACDVAFMLEGECYGVTCLNNTLCETRPARNPARYNPKIVYVYHDKNKDKASQGQKLKSLIKMIDRVLYEKPQKQTGTNFTPVDDRDIDTTDLVVDSDFTSDVSNGVRYHSNPPASSKQPQNRNLEETLPTDILTPTTPPVLYEKLVGNIKDGQMNVYSLPFFINDDEVHGSRYKSYAPLPSKSLNSLGGFYVKTPQNSNVLWKTPHKIDLVTSSVGHVPLIGFSPGVTPDGSGEKSQQSRLTDDKDLKDLLQKLFQEKNSNNKHNRHWRDDDEDLASYYDSSDNDLLSLNDADLNRVSDYLKLRLSQSQDSFTSQDVFTDRSPLHVQENAQQIAREISSLLGVSSTASTQQKNVCWDGEILQNYTLVGGINAGTFADNGKTENMDICMQFCCKRESCDLAFMIEDDCYSVACNSNGACEPRKARPTHYFPRIAIRKKPQGDYHVKGVPSDTTSTSPASSTPTPSPSSSPSPTPATSPQATAHAIPEPHQADGSVNPTVKVAHSCDATPIEYNVTLKMGLHSGVFQKIGKVDSMDDCIEMSCKQSNSDVAFMLGSMCFAVHCYSDDLCKTVPIFGSSISRLNLNPAISFLKKKSRFRVNSLAVPNDAIYQDKCRDSTITYNVTLRGGIDAGNFTERAGTLSMRDCIGKCCGDSSCDLAFMFGDSCYSVECRNEKLCQAVLAKPSHLEPKISYVSRGYFEDKDKGTMFSANDQTPTCRADQKSRSKVVSNKTLVGGLEAGKFSFVGVVSDMNMCMDRCCAQQGCNVAYMVDKNCFSVSCFSPALCKISDVSSTNGDVEISTIMNSTAEKPTEKNSMVVYVIIGVVGFAAGAGGILWAVCMFIRRHRLRSRHRQDTE